MKEVKVSELTGGEYLSKPVILSDNQILYYEGTCLYMNHIETLFSVGIESVWVFQNSVLSPKEKMVIKESIRNDCTNKVKSVLENYVTIDESFREISEAATEIIDDLFSREEVVDHVYDIKERNGSLYEHCVSVATLSILTALKMNLSKWEVFDIGVGSLMHDMGLRYLSVEYKDVNLDDFSAKDLFEYKKHTLYGFSSVEKGNWMSNEAKKIILFHHERIDGSGYPFKQKTTSLGTRIVAVVDAFDDRLSGIGCKKGNVRKAIEDVKNGRDVCFDGRIVDFFLGFIAAYPVGTIVYTNRGEEAVVIEQNEHSTDRPKIRLIKDRDGYVFEQDRIVDLSRNESVFIDHVKDEE